MLNRLPPATMATTAMVHRRVLSILMSISLCNRQRRPTTSRWQRLFKTVLRDEQARPLAELVAARSRQGGDQAIADRIGRQREDDWDDRMTPALPRRPHFHP